MKKIIYVGAMAAIACLTASCDSLLDIQTKHAISEEKIVSENGCKGLIIGVYDLMQDVGYTGRDFLCIPEVLGDNCMPTPGSTKYTGYYNFTPRYNISIWSTCYEIMSSLNECLVYLDKLDQTANADQLRGEALFLRAYNYFNLAIVYGRTPGHTVDGFNLCVPLVLEPFNSNTDNIAEAAAVARNTVDEVWAQICDDLKQAIPLIGSSNAPYRASEAAARALLSRVYLYMGKWAECAEASAAAIKTAGMDLYSGAYTDVFSKGKETIFGLKFTEPECLAASSIHSAYGTVDDGYRDADGFGNGTGAGDRHLSITPDFISLIDFDTDTRAGAIRKVRLNTQELYWTTKFNSYGGIFGLDNIPLIRVAELYLNRAEAYVRMGNPASARADLNELRTSRGLGKTDLPDGELLDEILLQRRIELAFEGHRFFDMKRQGKNISRPEGLAEIPYDDYRVVSPIGTTELDVNKLLVDNPGY
ncbi:MAG: RagB/SusD family nutrient uptake outer membrane protein [Bacteroidales bacterium]|nr:RagB/SusD family nutrient uptake outer membrane protein [Bacteroidales bacterium]